jgi:hypothetical protein
VYEATSLVDWRGSSGILRDCRARRSARLPTSAANRSSLRSSGDAVRGALLELPVYSGEIPVRPHFSDMLASTNHRMPLVNAHSDYIPEGFEERMEVLGEFPTRESFRLLPDCAATRYSIWTRWLRCRAELEQRLAAHAPYLSLATKTTDEAHELTGAPD